MSAYNRQSTTSRKKESFRQPPCQDLVNPYYTVSSERTATDPLDKVRAQAYRDACRAACFAVEKVYQAEDFVEDLDKKLTGGQIAKLTAFTGGVKILWNRQFTTTAGRATCRVGFYPSATIELSDKLIDNQERLLNTVAHEFCHVANNLISEDLRAHRSDFRRWARKCEVAFKDLGIRVTTTHNYSSKFEFIWTCMNQDCGEETGYHSKRLNPKKDRCRRCGDFIVQTNPVARVLKSRREWDIWG